MKPKSLAPWFFTLGVTALLMVRAAYAADVQVMISAGFYGVYSELGAAFERTSGHHLITTRGPSMGDSPEAIPTRLARGEAADVVILDGGATDELGRRGLVRADSKVELARSLIGMVVRAGAAKPDIGNVEALRSTLLAAKSIAYSDSGSGTYLSTTLFPKLGVADQIAGKSRKVRGPPSGEQVAAVVARGEAEIGFQQVSELIHVPGITFVGTIPSEVQPTTFFAGALTNTVQQPEAASALIRFLASPEAAPVILKAGLTPLSERSQADSDISGTYKLIVEQRKIVETGETVPVLNPLGYITYGKDGRMLVLIVRPPRPKPEAIDKITDQQRADLLRTMTAYGGTYKFNGTTVEHDIDIAWNEVWAGTKQVRTVTRDGDRLTLTTPPFPFHTDGKMSVNMLVWERVK
jgi:molybdate transport system substrate-binding protein